VISLANAGLEGEMADTFLGSVTQARINGNKSDIDWPVLVAKKAALVSAPFMSLQVHVCVHFAKCHPAGCEVAFLNT
tara:strand:+ start:6876 stop:7106 length:231 start_codon:yes stop_codon:yes gene_type:complete